MKIKQLGKFVLYLLVLLLAVFGCYRSVAVYNCPYKVFSSGKPAVTAKYIPVDHANRPLVVPEKATSELPQLSNRQKIRLYCHAPYETELSIGWQYLWPGILASVSTILLFVLIISHIRRSFFAKRLANENER